MYIVLKCFLKYISSSYMHTAPEQQHLSPKTNASIMQLIHFWVRTKKCEQHSAHETQTRQGTDRMSVKIILFLILNVFRTIF